MWGFSDKYICLLSPTVASNPTILVTAIQYLYHLTTLSYVYLGLEITVPDENLNGKCDMFQDVDLLLYASLQQVSTGQSMIDFTP